MRRRWSVLAVLAFGGCNSTGVGNPAPVKLQLSIVRDDGATEAQGGNGNAAGEPAASCCLAGATAGGASAGEAGAAEAAGGEPPGVEEPLPSAAVHNAILVVGEVRFLACESSQDDSAAAGPFIVDLLHGGASPTIPEVLVPPGGFCGFDAPLAPETRPGRLLGRSVYFDGVRADGTPFRVYANLQATLRVRARPGVSWDPRPAALGSTFWALRPHRWVDSTELSALRADDDGSGRLIIDVERHPLLIRALRSRLAGSSTLYDDVNADDIFDPRDRDAIIGDGLADAD